MFGLLCGTRGGETVELLAHLHRLVHVLVYEWGRWKGNCRECRECFVAGKAGEMLGMLVWQGI